MFPAEPCSPMFFERLDQIVDRTRTLEFGDKSLQSVVVARLDNLRQDAVEIRSHLGKRPGCSLTNVTVGIAKCVQHRPDPRRVIEGCQGNHSAKPHKPLLVLNQHRQDRQGKRRLCVAQRPAAEARTSGSSSVASRIKSSPRSEVASSARTRASSSRACPVDCFQVAQQESGRIVATAGQCVLHGMIGNREGTRQQVIKNWNCRLRQVPYAPVRERPQFESPPSEHRALRLEQAQLRERGYARAQPVRRSASSRSRPAPDECADRAARSTAGRREVEAIAAGLAISMLSSRMDSTISQSSRCNRHVRAGTAPERIPSHCERRANVRSLRRWK